MEVAGQGAALDADEASVGLRLQFDRLVAHDIQRSLSEAYLQLFSGHWSDVQREGEVRGELVASQRQCARIPERAMAVDGDCGDAAADVHQRHAALALILAEDGLGECDGDCDDALDADTSAFDGANEGPDGGGLSGNAQRLHIYAEGVHADGVAPLPSAHRWRRCAAVCG